MSAGSIGWIVKVDFYRQNGYQIVRQAATPDWIAELKAVLFVEAEHGGKRNVLDSSEVAEVVRNLMPAAEACVGAPVQPIRGIFFDKQPGANWKVPYHQDRTIAVAERIDTDGFTAWSVKDGVVHVRPPIGVLEKTVALRLHLDKCHAENGALRVLPGTHRLGSLESEAIERMRLEREEEVLEVDEGDLIALSPLLLHASSPAVAPSHRRVLHLEYSSAVLPNGLRFCEWLPSNMAA